MVKYKWVIFIGIVIINITMHWEHFNKELINMHVWRQTQTQSTIINFYEEDFNILHPKKNNRGSGDGLFRMEFPLMQWLVAGLYKIFGNHLIITRIFMFVTSMLTILGMYQLLKMVFAKEKLAIIGSWAFAFSPAFFYFMVNPIPDVFALGAAIWGLALFWGWIRNNKISTLILSGILLSIGTLCKLPFIIYYIVPFIYFIIEARKNKSITKVNIIASLLTFSFIILPLAWYITVIPNWSGNGITTGMMGNTFSIATVIEYLIHNLVSALPELMLNYGSVPFFLAGFYFLFKNKVYKKPYFSIYLFLSIGILAYFLFEINMIAKVHEYYLFPFYPTLFMLVGYGAYHLLESNKPVLKYYTIISLIALPFITQLRFVKCWNEKKPGFNKDLLVYKNELRSAVPKDALCVAGNDESSFIMLYYIDKKGWSFSDSKPNIKQMIAEGAQFIYIDTSKMELNNEIPKYCEKLIIERGTIQVYQLKSQN